MTSRHRVSSLLVFFPLHSQTPQTPLALLTYHTPIYKGFLGGCGCMECSSAAISSTVLIAPQTFLHMILVAGGMLNSYLALVNWSPWIAWHLPACHSNTAVGCGCKWCVCVLSAPVSARFLVAYPLTLLQAWFAAPAALFFLLLSFFLHLASV